jgi:hypothetical protein
MTQTTPRALVTDKIHVAPNEVRTRFDVTNARTGEVLGFLGYVGPACWQAFNALNDRVGDADGYFEPRLALVPLVAAYRADIRYFEDRA